MNPEDIEKIKAVVREVVSDALASQVPRAKGKKSKKQIKSTVVQEKYQELGAEKFKAWIQESDDSAILEAIDESGFSGPLLRRFWTEPGFKEKVGETLVSAMLSRSNRGSSFIGV
jgi:hypothetical protein